jgi:prepilin-type N-terminal cleavage/methylation domain-containing protein
MDSRSPRGFSLLELMIVLGIMVGAAALTFPRLTRPLSESDAQQAANRLRDGLSECQQTASLHGVPLFVQLQAGESRVVWGDWSVLLAEEASLGDASALVASSASSLGSSNFAARPAGISPAGTAANSDGRSPPADATRSFELPHGVVIASVHFGRNQPITANAPTITGATSEEAAPAGQRWYLPFLPSGRTRDCRIVLHDPLTSTELLLELDAATGMMRVDRLGRAVPREPTATGRESGDGAVTPP